MTAKKTVPAKTEKHAGGRPSSYTQAVGDSICARMARGESLRAICRIDKREPSTVLDWVVRHPEFGQQYARAREQQADALADEGMEIADAAHGQPSEVVAAARLRWDARRWYASKLAPKRYGDKVTQEVTGPEGGPLQVQQMPDWTEVRTALTKV